MTRTLSKLIFLLITSFSLYAQNTLQSIYYVESKDINISSIIQDTDKDFTLFKFQNNRYTKRIKAKDLINILDSHGYSDFTSQSRYIKFIKKSPIDLSKIRFSIEKFYLNSYPKIILKSIVILPRGYIKSLPQDYTVNIPPKNNLSKRGTVHIRTQENKKIFFDYNIVAKIDVFVTKQNIKRGDELSFLNVKKKNIILDRFRAVPIQKLEKNTLESKHNKKSGKLLTVRDVQTINLVKRNTIVNVSLNNNAIAIEFNAKALQNGKLNDIITIQKNNGIKIKAVVVGKSKVEIK